MTGDGGFGSGIDEVRQASADGRHLDALRRIADLVALHGEDEALLAVAADAWVAAVDAGAPLSDWPEHDRFAGRLILQQGCAVSPPVFHHRVASQRSSGVAEHFKRAADALAPLLGLMLRQADVHSNVVLMAAMLRSELPQGQQATISRLHREHFVRFRQDDLKLPYSVLFDRPAFGANVADLAGWLDEHRFAVRDGSVPLGHVLLLVWLLPDAFTAEPADWWSACIAARLGRGPLDDDDARSARSLAVRFGSAGDRQLVKRIGAGDAFAAAVEKTALTRGELLSGSPNATSAAGRLDQRPRQAIASARSLVGRRIPFIVRAKRKPKVALCVSGQLRGFRQSLASWQRTLLPGIDGTFFIHSWQRIGRAQPVPNRSILPFDGERFSAEYRAIAIELGLEAMTERYPALFTELAESGVVDEASLSDLYRTPHVRLENDEEPRFAAWPNPEKMHRKIESSFDMAAASGEEFDLVIRLRPDKPIRFMGFDWADMMEATRAPLLYAETAMDVHYGAIAVGDQFALGSFAASQVYARSAGEAPDLWRFDLMKFDQQFTGHITLAQVCWLHGIAVRKVPIKFGPLQDPEPVGARTIARCLREDSAGRDDGLDRRLIAAIEADLR